MLEILEQLKPYSGILVGAGMAFIASAVIALLWPQPKVHDKEK